MKFEETILLAEDDSALRHLVARVLRGAGYTIIEAADGEEALLCAANHGRIDLLVTDIVMPKLDGLELAQRLRARNEAVAVVYMSGYPLARDGKQRECVADASWLNKPFMASDLLREVRSRLEKARPGRSRPSEAPDCVTFQP